MDFLRSTPRRLLALGLALALSGCVETTRGDGLYFRAPQASGATSVKTGLSADEAAAALQAAGLGDARVARDGSLRLSSTDPRLVDCGTLIQVSFGNEAEFPGNARDAVLMRGFTTPGLIRQMVSSSSDIRLTPLADGSGYAIDEAHQVTRRLDALETGAKSRQTIRFDESTSAGFGTQVTCRSSGLVAAVLR